MFFGENQQVIAKAKLLLGKIFSRAIDATNIGLILQKRSTKGRDGLLVVEAKHGKTPLVSRWSKPDEWLFQAFVIATYL